METFVCPMCKGSLLDEHSSYYCEICHRTYIIRKGIPCFNTNDTWHGELSRVEMNELIQIAEKTGWRKALFEYKGSSKRIVNRIIDERRTKWRKLYDFTGNEVILDLGCGFGGISVQLSKLAQKVVALDNCFERVEFLKIIKEQENISNIFPVCNDQILNLPFSNNYFDIVTLIGVFEYLPLALPSYTIKAAHKKALEEILRVLKPGGFLYLATQNRYGWQYLTGSIDHNRIRFGPVIPRFLANAISLSIRKKPYRIIYHGLSGYKALLSEVGFNNVVFYWPIPSYQFPEYTLLIDKKGESCSPYIQENYNSPFKRVIFRTMEKLDILKYCVPSYSIIAQKELRNGSCNSSGNC
jgi:SAM-dependent methyltransferase